MKPKHHFVSHYAELTRRYGPLSHYSTLRFESKHSFFKDVIKDCGNFKNVCTMLAQRHQHLQCYLFASGNLFSRPGLVVRSGTLVSLSYSPYFESLLKLSFLGTDVLLWITKCQFNGIDNRANLYVIDGFEFVKFTLLWHTVVKLTYCQSNRPHSTVIVFIPMELKTVMCVTYIHFLRW